MKYKIMSAVFVMCLTAAFLMFLTGKSDTSSENREAAKMPQLTAEQIKSGDFAKEFDNYVNDKIAYRNNIIELSQKISLLKGEEAPEGQIIRAEVDKGTGIKQSSNLLILNGTVMEMFEKNHAAADKYAKALNNLSEKTGGAKLYSILVPTQLEFCEDMYSNLEDSQKEEINYIYSQTNGSVNAVNVYDALKAHSNEYIYFRTDHHWTMRGAYYAYMEFCAATNSEGVNINDYQMNTLDEFNGYLSAYAKGFDLKPDIIEWYDVNERGNVDWSMRAYNDDGTSYTYRSTLYDKTQNNYDFFLGSDHSFACFTNSELPDGKTIVIICDSYANDFVPWMINNYKNVIIIDPRTYKSTIKNTIDEYNPDEVLVLNYIFTASFEDYCDKLLSVI